MRFSLPSLGTLLQPFAHLYWRLSRPVTLGVRAVVVDEEGNVFLVRHSYQEGWHLPGGGVEAGETLQVALERELMEEGNIEVTGEPRLFNVYFNANVSNRDHIALFIVDEFHQGQPKVTSEIVEHAYFAPDELPYDIGRGARARIEEVFFEHPVNELW
jgi:ADP-ribose pyrophosphatase YjhB (NUDIX family)